MNILELFNIPNKAQINRKIFIKDILNRLELSSRDKRIFEKNISNIYVKGILNESTTNIWSYVDDTYYYKEIIIFYITLKDITKVSFINEQLQKVFPNPIIIFYEFNNKYAISTALKRLNKLEKGKTVIEEIQLSNFFELDDKHIQLLNKHSYDFNNLKKYYENFNNLVATEEIVNLTGIVPTIIDETIKTKSIKLKKLLKQKKELLETYKEADSMQERMTIHMKIKEIEKQLEVK